MSSQPYSMPARQLLLAILIITTALGPFSMQIFLPSLPIIRDEFAVSPAVAQLAFSLSAFAMAVATLLYGPLSDSIGRRPAMLLGLCIFLFGSWICAIAPTITWLVLGRVVQAAGGCAGMALGRAIVRDIMDREHSASAIAYITMAMVAAPMIAPALGGWLTDLTGWRAVFWAGLGVGIAVAIMTLAALPETHRARAGGVRLSDMVSSFTILLREPTFIAYALQAAFSMSVFFAFLGAAPYVALNVIGLTASEYGIYFMAISAAFMFGNFTAARLTQLFGIERMILFGATGTLICTSIGLAAVLAGFSGSWGIFAPMFFTSLFQGLAVPNAQAAVVGVRPEIAGAASGLGGFLQLGIAACVAQLIGSLQFGSAIPMVTGMLATAILSFLFALRAHTLAR